MVNRQRNIYRRLAFFFLISFLSVDASISYSLYVIPSYFCSLFPPHCFKSSIYLLNSLEVDAEVKNKIIWMTLEVAGDSWRDSQLHFCVLPFHLNHPNRLNLVFCIIALII